MEISKKNLRIRCSVKLPEFFFAFLLYVPFSLAQLPDRGIERIVWRGPERWLIPVVFFIALAVALFFVIYYYRNKFKQSRDRKKHLEKLFNEGALEADLNSSEIVYLRKIVDSAMIREPHTIFQSVTIFERCVQQEIGDVLRASDQQKLEKNLIIGSIRKKLGYNFLPLEHPLVSTRNITIGQRGSLFGTNLKKPVIQKATVVDNTENMVTLQYNVEHEDVYHFSVGNKLRFAFARRNDGFYGIELTLVECDNAGKLAFSHTLDLKRNQLRQYVRIEVSIPLKLRLLKTTDPDTSEVQRGQLVEAKISDLSGGGMSFICPYSLKAGDMVSMTFHLPEVSFAGIQGKVLRISLQEGKTQTFYRHHVHFSSIEQSKREKIIKFVFDKQRQINQWR